MDTAAPQNYNVIPSHKIYIYIHCTDNRNFWGFFFFIKINRKNHCQLNEDPVISSEEKEDESDEEKERERNVGEKRKRKRKKDAKRTTAKRLKKKKEKNLQ